MRFVYPNEEATQWANLIYKELSALGYVDLVDASLLEQRQIEADIENEAAKLKRLYSDGQHAELLRTIMPYYRRCSNWITKRVIPLCGTIFSNGV